MAHFTLNTTARPRRSHGILAALVGAAALASEPASAQTSQLDTVTVVGRAQAELEIGSWGAVPLGALPLQASVFGEQTLRDQGTRRLADLTALDASVTDAYNSVGYWDALTVRGFVINNRLNYRREGLPIHAETALPLDNKARVEVLKGASGMAAGTSAPGGLVNLLVKRPLDAPLLSARLAWQSPGSVAAGLDWSTRLGADDALGLRVNAAAERLNPSLRAAKGQRSLLAVATEARVGTDATLAAEVEISHHAQPSQPGFSLLGNRVPAPVDPRINLNNQPWSQPVVFDATTASLRWQQRLGSQWWWSAQLGTQQVRTDDRVAFPYGCTDASGAYWPDRYCPDGTLDLYDFRSENERRRIDAVQSTLSGTVALGGFTHRVGLEFLQSRTRNRFGPQVYNYSGTGNVAGTAVTPAAPTLGDPSAPLDERSTEFALRDTFVLQPGLTAWLGLRYTVLARDSGDTRVRQHLNTPFVALSYSPAANALVYASWGQGLEALAVPQRPLYTNAGQVLPAMASKQVEVGARGNWKSDGQALDANVALFDIAQPQSADFGSCDAAQTCTTRVDGTERHQGLEANTTWARGPFTARLGTQLLRARREGSAKPGINGLQPTNVPAQGLKAGLEYRVPQLAGLTLHTRLVAESRRQALPDNSLQIPGLAHVDAGLRYATTFAGRRATWRLSVDNLTDLRAWRESPYQFSHAYLYPLAPRTVNATLDIDL